MGLVYVFSRITRAEAALLAEAPDAADELLESLHGREDLPSGDLDKAWDGLRCLLTAALDFDLLREDETSTREDCLTVWSPDEIAIAAAVLAATPFDHLAEHFSPELMDDEGALPDIWDQEWSLGYLRDAYDVLRIFFTHAATTDSAALARFE
ncbi:hypothetical protein NN3_47560 [Nocardia neocaledoniensis NBRC 108232]|uniref:Uncharacterized protein DUF1877 n=1 Tax=Nocardia neocaledoniensis TaxID=236511 RepID=A0A317N2V8_9NOCA|nr:DUF1877 family protein [Nocardia neocaledoniensis]PWV67879.1 uncharacterized protein DUF1877 [Nocardia neocaledoniensis]GEM33749.1 hypothetical protein NN3_47560 [Nocardia neocaledoniensis NBRC 108232]